jgi:hypothetical protein
LPELLIPNALVEEAPGNEMVVKPPPLYKKLKLGVDPFPATPRTSPAPSIPNS